MSPKLKSMVPFILLTALALAITSPILAAPSQPGTPAAAIVAPAAQSSPPGQPPAGLSPTDWNSIQAQIAVGPYRTYLAESGGYTSANPAHGWQIAYGPDGVTTLTPRDRDVAPWIWGLQLTGYGYGTPTPVPSTPHLDAADSSFAYHWDANLTEWWRNTPAGLEQGFTLQTRPDGGGRTTPLQLDMAVSGDLTAVRRGANVAFVDANGATLFTYAHLHVTDATGQSLPAHFSLSPRVLSIIVGDAHATYPLTIDPWVQQAYLKASNTGVDDSFGYAVAVSGNTVVVGAYTEDSNATGVGGNQGNDSALDAGAVYVFVRSGVTWSQQAYLKASNTDASDYFGYSVAIAGDTVVVGARGEDSNATGIDGNQDDDSVNAAGAAYIFVRSGTTWTQQAYLKASNTDAGDYFGYSVSISGDTVVVGAC